MCRGQVHRASFCKTGRAYNWLKNCAAVIRLGLAGSMTAAICCDIRLSCTAQAIVFFGHNKMPYAGALRFGSVCRGGLEIIIEIGTSPQDAGKPLRHLIH